MCITAIWPHYYTVREIIMVLWIGMNLNIRVILETGEISRKTDREN
jgi:hypothetical protein